MVLYISWAGTGGVGGSGQLEGICLTKVMGQKPDCIIVLDQREYHAKKTAFRWSTAWGYVGVMDHPWSIRVKDKIPLEFCHHLHFMYQRDAVKNNRS